MTTVFEVTVAGGLCPSLEAALAPFVSRGLHVTTVVRLRRGGGDLVETYGELVRNGVEVADLTQLDEDPTGHGHGRGGA